MSQNIPSEQWAQVIEKTGGPVQYKKIPVQKPGPDEVLVNVKYSGEFSYGDASLNIRAGCLGLGIYQAESTNIQMLLRTTLEKISKTDDQ